jgi:hypothetical protein
MTNSPKKPTPSSSTKPHLSPSTPGFSAAEAGELLGMCVVANYLGPVVFAPFPPGLTATNNPDDPLPNDDGKTYPYPAPRIWPKGWGPAVDSGDAEQPWAKSVLTSRLSNGVGINGAIISYNAARKAYAVAFAGTLNTGAAMQNLAGLLIPAGPVNLGYFNSSETYVTEFPSEPVTPTGGLVYPGIPEPPDQMPRVHLGYRQAMESLAVGPQTATNNLKTILANADGDEIDLYVTGHSLGAPVAQLFSAWVRAGGVPGKKINVKCYSFATPKSSNPPMASNYALALGNEGFAYRIDNSLDTAQQLPPSTDKSTDLINPGISSDLLGKATPTGPYLASPLTPIIEMILHSGAAPGSAPPTTGGDPIPFPFSIFFELLKALDPKQGQAGSSQPPVPMNFVGMGVPHVLAALPPVIYNGRCYPPEFFPGREPGDWVEIPDDTTRQWWQHWPANYAKYLADSDQ